MRHHTFDPTNKIFLSMWHYDLAAAAGKSCFGIHLHYWQYFERKIIMFRVCLWTGFLAQPILFTLQGIFNALRAKWIVKLLSDCTVHMENDDLMDPAATTAENRVLISNVPWSPFRSVLSRSNLLSKLRFHFACYIEINLTSALWAQMILSTR